MNKVFIFIFISCYASNGLQFKIIHEVIHMVVHKLRKVSQYINSIDFINI